MPDKNPEISEHFDCEKEEDPLGEALLKNAAAFKDKQREAR